MHPYSDAYNAPTEENSDNQVSASVNQKITTFGAKQTSFLIYATTQE